VRHLMTTDQLAFPVIRDGILVGIVCVPDIRPVPRERWPRTRVADVMTPGERLVTLDVRARASDVLEKLAAHEIDQVPIIEGSKLRGLVRRRDLLKWLATREVSIVE
jgi:CBS domain-containing protein